MRVCLMLVVVGVAVAGLERSRGMRIAALTPLWSRNACVIFSVSCVCVAGLWGSCIKMRSIHVACSG